MAAPRPVTNAYHGVTVADPYQWLESDDDAVKAWSTGQNRYTRTALDHLPALEKIRGEIRAIVAAPSDRYYGLIVAGHKLFAFRKQSTHEQPELVVMTDPSATDPTVVLDPAAGGGAQQAIDWMVPSPDGTRIAVSVSSGGSEEGSLHIIGLDGRDQEPVIPNVQRGTGGGSVAWTADSKGLYYTRYPAAGERPEEERNFWMQVWFHQLGTAKDRYEIGKDLPKIAEILLASDDRNRVIASVQNGDGGTFRHYLHDKTGWRQLDDWADGLVEVTFGPGEELWLVSRSGAPRGKVLRLAGTAKTAMAAKLVIPEGKDAIVTSFDQHPSLVTTRDRLFVTYQLGGPTELRAFTFDGKSARSPALPPVSSARVVVGWKTGVVLASTSYVTPWAYRYFEPRSGDVTELPAISTKSPVDLSAFTVSRELATSKDGTKIPLNIIWPKGAAKTGATPCIVTGYGGYGIDETPYFASTWAPLLTRGFCVVDVNLRGGSEFGEEWHRAGALTHKQNVFDDFAAAMQYVVAQGYTSVPRLGIIGGSNGGLLMGAMITQHPELFHVAVSEVGIYDMLRVELSPNGAYNTTEFGSVSDADQFKALYAYSPYHHVAHAKYPAILMTTGANDPRVSPWHSRKMIAALQASQAGDAPILLRTTDKAGHGMGSSMTEAIDLLTDVETFLLAQLKN